MTHYFPSRQGGIEAVAFEINRRLVENGHVVEWFASATPSLPESVPGLHYRQVQAIELVERLVGVPLPIWLWKGVPQLWAAIRDCDALHVHDFIYPGSLLAMLFARVWGKTVVLTQHIGEIPYNSRVLCALLSVMNRVVGRMALQSASRVVFISNAVESYFRSFTRFRTQPLYLPNGVDSAVFHPVDAPERQAIRSRLGLAEDAFVCLFVGRFVEKKGLGLLGELVRRTPEIQWLFAGWGPLHPREWQAANVRVFEGWQREKLADLYRAADLLVLPSRGEGFPLVVQEAFACGTPALVSDETAAGCKEANGLLLELPVAGPQVIEQWQAELSRLCADASVLSARRGAVAAFSRKAWSWDAALELYSRLYADPLYQALPQASTS